MYQFLKDSKISSSLNLTAEGSILTEVGTGMMLSLCLVTSRGDRNLLEKFLERGRDPNTTDYCGRTPLVSMYSIFFGCSL